MICIGKECDFNKNNAGEYCSLKCHGTFVCKGNKCIIEERIAELEDEMEAIQIKMRVMKSAVQVIRDNQ